MKKTMSNLSFTTFGFILGTIILLGIGIGEAKNIASSTIAYNKNNQATVDDALDDLYNKVDSCEIIPGYGKSFAEYITGLYTTDGENKLYFHDKKGTYGTYESGDLSYRYSGSSASVENYVCFGSDAIVCPGDNLYRIIGVIDGEVKLIKARAADSIILGTNGTFSKGRYRWNNSTKNTWSSSPLNTVNLNTNLVNYYNNINSKWMNMVDTHTWIVGGSTYDLIVQTAGAHKVYSSEIISPATGDTYSDEIGLMYVSDYMYAAAPSNWKKSGTAYYKLSDNWMALGPGYGDLTITRDSSYSDREFFITGNTEVNSQLVYSESTIARPAFYLKSGVIYIGGTGKSSDPYRIS